eukprot:g2702.t1
MRPGGPAGLPIWSPPGPPLLLKRKRKCFPRQRFPQREAEFTSVSLLKAAQLQWACAHLVPIVGLLISASLEVESGVARALVDFICEAQDAEPNGLPQRDGRPIWADHPRGGLEKVYKFKTFHPCDTWSWSIGV